MDERALSELRALAESDAELAGRADELRERDADLAALRARAEAIDVFLALYPEQESGRRRAVAAAGEELARRRAELARAEAELARASDEDRREHARHAVERAHDHIAVATSSLARAEGELAELERDAGSLPLELAELEARTPVTGAQALVEWAAHEHAALFVELGQIDLQRERVIREANELASMLLGEPTYGSTAAQALARVERYWVSSPGQVSESR